MKTMNLDKDKAPSTITEAVDALVGLFSEEDKNYIRENQHPRYHFFAGRCIRNEWSLWQPDSTLVKDAKANYQITHADDISGLIFEWAFAKIRGQPFDPLEHVKIYHEHWKKMSNQDLEKQKPC